MKLINFLSVLCIVAMLASCDNVSKNRSYKHLPFKKHSSSGLVLRHHNKAIQTVRHNVPRTSSPRRQESAVQLVVCPMCNGTGTFEFMPGDILAPRETCRTCKDRGICDVNSAQQTMQAKAMVDVMMGNNGSSNMRRGRNASQIENDLSKANELLEDMNRQYSNTDGVVARSQYPRMIANQKERIRQLEAELRGAY